MIKKLLLSILFILSGYTCAYSEIIYLKDGQVLKGAIITEDKKSITLKNKYQTRRLYRRHILRILFGEHDMESVYILMKDGNLINGFLVDQDVDKVIFRTEKDSPVEETISKNRISQISNEKINPLYPDITVSMGSYIPISSGGADLTISPMYIIGSSIDIAWINNSRAMLELGYTKSSSSYNGNQYMQIMPLIISATYNIPFSYFNIIPKLGAGAAYIVFVDGNSSREQSFDFAASAGTGLSYEIIKKMFSAVIWCEYNLLVEGSETLNSVVLRGGLNYRF